jgi:hypothetical protein
MSMLRTDFREQCWLRNLDGVVSASAEKRGNLSRPDSVP